jgi:D-alanyl-D-alanine carboxypeptidase (penicillin-binding protein 5/6)
VKQLEVYKGAERTVKAGFRSDLFITVPKGETEKLKADLLSEQPLLAPVAQGQRVGTLRVTLDGKPLVEYPVLALETVPVAGILRRAWDTLRLWLK